MMGMRLKDSTHRIVTERASRLTAAGTGAEGMPVEGWREVALLLCNSPADLHYIIPATIRVALSLVAASPTPFSAIQIIVVWFSAGVTMSSS